MFIFGLSRVSGGDPLAVPNTNYCIESFSRKQGESVRKRIPLMFTATLASWCSDALQHRPPI